MTNTERVTLTNLMEKNKFGGGHIWEREVKYPIQNS
jgi:hypothetical protein